MREVGRSGDLSGSGNHEEYEIDECCKIAESMMEKIQMLDETKTPQKVVTDEDVPRSGRSIKQKLIRSLKRVKDASPSGIS